MGIHAQRIDLLERGEGSHEHDHQSASSDCFNSPAQQVRSDWLEILKNKHIECLAQNSLSLLVVTVCYFRRRDKELEWVIHVRVVVARGLFLLHLLHALLLMRTKAQFFLVAPQDCWSRAYSSIREQGMEINYLVSSSVAYNQEKASVFMCHRSLYTSQYFRV